MIRRFVTVRPGGQLSAAELNRAFAEIERATQITVAHPLEVTHDGSGTHIRIGGAPSVAAVKVTDPSESGPGSLDYWPAQVDLFQSSDGTFFQTLPVWLLSRDGSKLTEDSVYLAVLQNAAVAISGDGRPVYVTAGASGACPDDGGSGSGGCPNGTPLGDLIQCETDGSGNQTTQIRNVCLAVNVCGRLYPVVALDPDTGEQLG